MACMKSVAITPLSVLTTAPSLADPAISNLHSGGAGYYDRAIAHIAPWTTLAVIALSVMATGCNHDCGTFVQDTGESTASLRYTESSQSSIRNQQDLQKYISEYDKETTPYNALVEAGAPGTCSAEWGAVADIGSVEMPRCVYRLNSVSTDAFQAYATRAVADAAASTPVVTVGFGYGVADTLTFDVPRGPGSYRLEDLHATVCDDACAPVAGTLTVNQFVGACGEGACGRFDADLLIPREAGSGSSAPSLSGQAHLVEFQQSIANGCGGGFPNLIN
jgi:hypothetical protein